MEGPPGTANGGGSGARELMQLLAGLHPQQQQKPTPLQPAPQHRSQQQGQLIGPSADAALVPSADAQRSQPQPAPPQDHQHQQPPLPQQDVGAALRHLMEGMRQAQGAAAVQQQQQQQPTTQQGAGGAGEGFLVTLLQVLAAAGHNGQQQPLQPHIQPAAPQQLPRSTSALALAPPMPMSFTQLRPWPAAAAVPAAPALLGNPQSITSTWMHTPPPMLDISAGPSSGPSTALPGIATASNADHAAIRARSAASVQGGGSPRRHPPVGPNRRRCDSAPPFLIPPEAKRRRSGADAIYGVQQQQQQQTAADGPALPHPAQQAPPPQLAQQLAAAAATLAAAMTAGQAAQPLHSGAVQQRQLGTHLPLGLQLAGSPVAIMSPTIPHLAAGTGLDFQAALAAATVANNAGRQAGAGHHRASGSPVTGLGSTPGSGRHSNVHGYGVPVTAPEGMRRSDLVALYTTPREQVERSITNQTYILRLHVTTQMAQLLFPPRADLEAAHQAAAALEPAPANSRLGGGSTYTQLFKQRLTVVDDSNRAWPVQYEGFLSSGQRHYRLTSGWVGLMRAQNVTIGDTLVLERWTDDKWIIHLRIQRKAELEAAAAQQEHDAATILAGAASGLAPPLPPLPPAPLPPLLYEAPLAAGQAAAPDQPSQLDSTAAAAGQAVPHAAVELKLQPLDSLQPHTTAPDSAAQHNAPLQPASAAVPAVQPDMASGQLVVTRQPLLAEHAASGSPPAEHAAVAAAEAEAALTEAFARPARPAALGQEGAAAAAGRNSDSAPQQH